MERSLTILLCFVGVTLFFEKTLFQKSINLIYATFWPVPDAKVNSI